MFVFFSHLQNAYVLRIEMRYIRGGMEVDDSVEYEDFSIGSDAERYVAFQHLLHFLFYMILF